MSSNFIVSQINQSVKFIRREYICCVYIINSIQNTFAGVYQNLVITYTIKDPAGEAILR